jgi:tRNA (guanine37-N1)-methyltransferase
VTSDAQPEFKGYGVLGVRTTWSKEQKWTMTLCVGISLCCRANSLDSPQVRMVSIACSQDEPPIWVTTAHARGPSKPLSPLLHWQSMQFDLITIFPEFFAGPLDHGILRRARETGLVEVHVQDLREFTRDRHRTVDDRPFGGGEGMVLKPEPLFEAVESLLGHGIGDATKSCAVDPKTSIILLSAAGKLFTQEMARRYAELDRIVFICGRYEGVDERVAGHLATEEISIGDFVLSGGELAAMLVIDAVTRLLPGALGNEASSQNESFSEAAHAESATRHLAIGTSHESLVTSHALLDFPHYTRPAEYRGWSVPEVLIGGHHAEVAKWRRAAAIEKTRRNRPDLL